MNRQEIVDRINKIDGELFVLEMSDSYDSRKIYELEQERKTLSAELIKLDETTKES